MPVSRQGTVVVGDPSSILSCYIIKKTLTSVLGIHKTERLSTICSGYSLFCPPLYHSQPCQRWEFNISKGSQGR